MLPKPHRTRTDCSNGNNSTSFQPYRTAARQLYDRYCHKFKDRATPFIHLEPTSDGFLFPLTREDISNVLDSIPTYIQGLQAVLVTQGHHKTSALCLGQYSERCIFLHPYPKNALSLLYNHKPNPCYLQNFRQAGAALLTVGPATIVTLDKTSLRNLYLAALLHEIAHLYDDLQGRPFHKREGFADRFALDHRRSVLPSVNWTRTTVTT